MTKRKTTPYLKHGPSPMQFDQAIADHLCERIVTSTDSLRTICEDEGMPSVSLILKWLSLYPSFEAQYAKSKEQQIEALVSETLDIADDGRNDYMERLNFDGSQPGWHLNGEALARSRLRIDTRKWLAGKLKPKKYGEKIEVDQKVSASDPLMSLLTRIAENGQRLVPGIAAPETEDDKDGE